MAALDGLYPRIIDNYLITFGDVKMVNLEQAFQDGEHTSKEEWEGLIMALLENKIDVIVEKESIKPSDIETVLTILQVKYPDCFEETDGSKTPTQTRQGRQNSCFAHAAANIILHNVYKFRINERDIGTFIEKDCNKYLDTSRPIGAYADMVGECGESGAIRILLFHYIYRVITKRYGDNIGPLGYSIHYYLQQPFDDTIFSPELSAIIREEIQSKDLSLYCLSIVPINKFVMEEYDGYFAEYYAAIHVLNPMHFFTIVGIKGGEGEEIEGKDSYTGKSFTTPKGLFHFHGRIQIGRATWTSLLNIYLLFDKSKLSSYPKIVEEKLPREFRVGGRKSRKRRKTRRKRTKNKN